MKLAPAAVLLVALGGVPEGGADRTFSVDTSASSVRIHVGKAGLFSFAGHQHEVLAPRLSGEIVANGEDLTRSSVTLSFDAAALQVSGKGEPPEDVPKVQARMIGTDLLDVARFPTIAFRSKSVAGKPVGADAYDLTVEGELTLHGATRPLKVMVHVEVKGETLTASGRGDVKHSVFGLNPISVAGVVKVKNEIGIDFSIVARARP